MTTVLMLLFGVTLAAGTSIFVSAELLLVAVDQAVFDKKVGEGDRGAASVPRATRTLSTQLSDAQVGITSITILLDYTTQSVLADLLEDLLGSIGLAWGLATGIAALVVAAFVNVFSMPLGELAPKNLALAHPLTTAVCVVLFQMVFTAIARPVTRVPDGIMNWVLARMGIEPQEEISSARSAPELAALVEHSVEEGTFDMSMVDLFVNMIRMPTLSAADVMIDRGRLHTLSEGDGAQDMPDLAHETGHSRFSVIGDNSDDIPGLVLLRRAVAVPADCRAEVPVISSSLTTDASSVPETAPIGPLTAQLRDEGLQMAVAVDEYGGVSGTTILEGVVEEIVDEVSDEHDQRRLGIRPRPDGIFPVPSTLRPDEFARCIDINLPEDGPYDTIGGLVMNELGEIPAVGSRVNVDGIGIEVTQMQGRRVTQVAITPAPEVENKEVSL